jgi:threonine synthase
VTYYFAAAAALGAPQRSVSFVVPTGNFGDIFAGYVAKRMGLPIERLVIASNVNDILPRTLESGAYEMHEVVATTSPSMDIQISSNFERYLFEASGRDAALVRDKMRALRETGRFDLGPLKARLCQDFAAAAASEDDVPTRSAACAPSAATSSILIPPALSSPPSACSAAPAEPPRLSWRRRTRRSFPMRCRGSRASVPPCPIA